ncbi:NnrS family protein [Pseudoalteromonas sp. MMG012]|uniref:NnrS family protein n=1 Tax=Pseudoalteromonas sp. MMG012 TaxID=2822686 RepID=UPI001B3A6B1E|nr:NnrS family protein [Pseudoalteromonas sp. MMG012]MBQ4850410.1 NnrS family protein [Pseudoalteromonas sp. MMG012]
MRPINLAEPVLEQYKWYQVSQWPLFMMPFRAFFLLASIWGALAIILWALLLTGKLQWQTSLPASLWHAHEMIFAFAGAIAVSFLLTAAQTWTNVPSMSGPRLITLLLIWCITRITFFVSPHLLPVVILGQLAFWLYSIVYLSHMLISAKSKNNYAFIAILSGLCTFNILFLIVSVQGEFMIARTFSQLAVLGFMLLIGVVGGRVIPFFTARGLKLEQQIRTPLLDKLLLIISTFGIGGFAVNQLFSVPINPGYLIVLASVLHLTRSALWFHKGIVHVPLLWSLQLGYLFSACGLLLCGVSFFTPTIIFTDALHLITLGGIGLTILAMIARVSLGHTGRALTPNKFMSIAFALLALGAVIRAFLPQLIGPHPAWIASAILWSAAFAVFSISYFKVLTHKRVDGRRG